MVNDSGPGIPPEVLPRLFEAIFTTKLEGKGTGLGLPTVKRIVNAHAGFISLTSTPGEGTSFEIFIPRSTPAATSVAPEDSKLPRGDGQTVMVIDENAAAREMLCDALASQGYTVLATGAASEALENTARGEWKPSLLVLDPNLAGVDGLELLPILRRDKACLPAILIGIASTGAKTDKAPLTEYLERPVAPRDLLQLVDQLLKEAGQPRRG